MCVLCITFVCDFYTLFSTILLVCCFDARINTAVAATSGVGGVAVLSIPSYRIIIP